MIKEAIVKITVNKATSPMREAYTVMNEIMGGQTHPHPERCLSCRPSPPRAPERETTDETPVTARCQDVGHASQGEEPAWNSLRSWAPMSQRRQLQYLPPPPPWWQRQGA